MSEFFLKSIELRDYDAIHRCSVIESVDENKLLIAVTPPIPAHVYEQTKDLDMLVLAPRYSGSILVPRISEWPCVVNICLPEIADRWDQGPWRLLDIGEISRETK